MYIYDPSVKMLKNTSYSVNQFWYTNIIIFGTTLIVLDVIYVMCGGYREGLLVMGTMKPNNILLKV